MKKENKKIKKDIGGIVLFDVFNTLYSPRKGIYEDVKETLENLRKNNIVMGIISSMSKESILEILEIYNIKEYFDIIISAEEYSTRKPDPKLINIALTLLKDKGIQVSKDKTYYVGDRPDVDVRMANLAGIHSIRIIRGKYATKEEEGKEEKAKYIIKSLIELNKILGIPCIDNKKIDDFEVI